MSVGAITGPALSLLPQAVAIVAREHPSLRVQLDVESSDVLLERLAQSKLDIMIGRLFERHDKTNLSYERLADEPVCAVVRPGHAMLGNPGLNLKQLAAGAVDRAAEGQRAATPVRADVPGRGAVDSAASHRDLVAAVHDEDAAAE